jgi:hypothetical protein
MIVFRDQHNHQEINNSIQEETHHIRINVINPYIDHEYHLSEKKPNQEIFGLFILYHKFLMVLQVRVKLVG